MTSIYTMQVGWVMNDGLVSFERVRDWEPLACQRHICEIQGYEPPGTSKVPLEPLLTPLPAEQLGASREDSAAFGAIALRDPRCGAPCEAVLKQVDRCHVSRAAYPHHLGCPGVLIVCLSVCGKPRWTPEPCTLCVTGCMQPCACQWLV